MRFSTDKLAAIQTALGNTFRNIKYLSLIMIAWCKNLNFKNNLLIYD